VIKKNNKLVTFSVNGVDYKETLPQEKKDSKGWITWGKDNLYPDYLISLTNRSALHAAILNLKATMIGENGFIDADWEPNTVQFLNNIKSKDDLETILGKIAVDLTIFNGFALQITWSKAKTILSIGHVPLQCIRIASPSDENPDYEGYYVRSDWSRNSKEEAVLLDAFDSNKPTGTQILYFKKYTAGNTFYPVPEYTAGISLMELNYHVNEYHLNTVLNQFSPSMHINFVRPGATDEERVEIAERVKEEYTGAKNAGKDIITIVESLDEKPSIEAIALNDSDTRFTAITKWMLDSIFSAHNISDQSLFGIEGPKELNNRTAVLESLSLFQANYISSKQALIEKQINRLGKIYGITEVLKIQRSSIHLEPNMPVGDLLAILQSTLSAAQKVSILINAGFTRNKALELVNSGNENNTPQ